VPGGVSTPIHTPYSHIHPVFQPPVYGPGWGLLMVMTSTPHAIRAAAQFHEAVEDMARVADRRIAQAKESPARAVVADVPMWEWSTSRDSQGGSVGLCATRHGAMEALAKALIARGFPSIGRVAQVKLVRSVHEESSYLRGFPARTAVYDGAVIRWS
jgi:hypothetical protein